MTLYNSTNIALLTPDIIKVLDEKITLYKSKNLYDAGVADTIGELCGIEGKKLKDTQGGAAGLFYCESKRIEIKAGYATDDIMFHEVSHYFQSQYLDWKIYSNHISDHILYEQQAETMAKYMFEKLHPKSDTKGLFTAYFNKESVQWLYDYHNEFNTAVENDIPHLIK